MVETGVISDSGPVFVSDFDGTMTRHDFYKLAIEKLLPADTPDYWAEYRVGAITHFEALRRYFAEIRKSESEVLEAVEQMELDPNLSAAVDSLKQAGWQVVVTSAGCQWYIDKLLSAAKVDLIIHTNPGHFESGKGLIMELPTTSPFFCENTGIDKAGVVRHYLAAGRKVAFAGDGFPDAAPARLVPSKCRFARGDLAEVLTQEGLEFSPFIAWSEIPITLLQQSD